MSLNGALGPRVLVAPLDWGLGHATRCIPVIYELEKQGAEVWLAGDGPMVVLLKKEFPHLSLLHLSGYKIKYRRTATGLLWSMLLQAPSILRSIRAEHAWLEQAVSEYKFAAVISDNRFGLYHRSVPTVFITHQLRINTPFGNWFTGILQKKNYSYINRFSYCWVPDTASGTSLAGDLSHPAWLPSIPVNYTGILSRLKVLDQPVLKNHLFISISGPEPQRSILENKILNDIAHYRGTAVIVRGLPGEARMVPSTNDICIFNHLPAEDYNREMAKAEWVICRGGYSTILDLARLQKKAVLIPTPGQTEQEYLGKWLQQNQVFPFLTQNEFSLQKALQKTSGFSYQFPQENNNLSALVSDLLHSVRK